MSRVHQVLPALAWVLALALAALSPAEGGKKAEAKGPAGLRIQNAGNSWSYNSFRLRAMEAAAGIKGGVNYPHSEVIDGKPFPIYTLGGLNGKKKGARECATLKAKLEAGKIDVFTYSHSGWHETEIAEEVAEFGFKHNKNFRVVWQVGWMVHDGLKINKNGPARDAVKIADLRAALDKARKPVEQRIEAINKKLGKRVVTIVPVGDAFVRMRALVVTGKFPGVTKQSELFNDDMPHQGRLGSLLQDYCVFAALYHKSPVGLEIKLGKGITKEQNAILQKIAWETVSKYPYAGLAKTTPRSSPQKPTPARDIQIRAGFSVERVYQVKGATEGSWVAMCFDDRGRIYASAQGDHGLFRITPPAIGSDEECRVELVSDKWGRCQGMAWINGSLYVVQHEQQPRGKNKVEEEDLAPDAILRLRDTDGDDKLDTAERLFAFPKVTDDKRVWYEHHIHGIVPGPDGKSIYVVSGDRNGPPCKKSRVAKHWNRDSWEFKSVPAPFSGGWVMRADLDGKNPEYLCMGLRNCYDIAFNRHGDLFTFDSDLEYDLGLPNYRPTAIRQILSGTDSGWAGSGPAMKWSWTPKWEDIQPPIKDIGPGSPTGVCFGYGARFPARYQEAFFACDWTFGRIFAVHLKPRGATYEAEVELFLSRKGLPITDIAVSPKDRALYFTTGGRGAGSNLYRVIYRGKESTAPSSGTPLEPAAAALHKLRGELEAFHGETNPRALAAVWQHLGHEDRAIRGAARAALEWQPVAEWKQKALEEKQPRVALQALLALSRSTDGDKTIQPALLAALDRFDFAKLSADEQCWYLRILTVSASRHGMYSREDARQFVKKLKRFLPSPDRRVNEELAAMFAAFQQDGYLALTLDLFERSRSQEEQIYYADVLLRDPKSSAWTPALRERFFTLAAERLPRWKGGAFVNPKREAVLKVAVAMLDDEQRKKFAERIAGLKKPSVVAPAKKREVVKQWKLDDLTPALESGLKKKRDLENGRALYSAATCFTCHSFQGDGGLAGPDLTNVRGRFTPREILDKILHPSKNINEQYGRLVYQLKNGKQVTGRVVETTGDAVIVATNPTNPLAEQVRINKKDVESATPSRVSSMPEGLLNTLTREEVLDLLAYLTSR